MSKFDEIQETHYSQSCENFYKNLGREGSGGGSFNMAIVKPSPMDFLADVELAARAVLTPPEQTMFKRLYLEKIEVPEAVAMTPEFTRVKNTIMAKVGREFIRRKIHPTSQYFKPVDIR